MSACIVVDNLGKRYELGRTVSLSKAGRRLKHRIAGFLAGRGSSEIEGRDYFWALRNTSFDVREGEVLGLVGANGAGKSTLLKILSRITPPTEGRATIRGRVASLLEVGTGFNLELTGRENIFLSGAILGLSRREIRQRFDQIVDFSGVEKFLDTPLKRFSSGMNVRLGFAVAAHLDPEILIVDEVLAVGDADFQKKCLGRMDTIRKSGRTILFVSHSMDTVSSLCDRALWVDRGTVRQEGRPKEIIQSYLNSRSEKRNCDLSLVEGRKKSGDIEFTDMRITNESGTSVETVQSGDTIRFVLGYASKLTSRFRLAKFSIGIENHFGKTVCEAVTHWKAQDFENLPGKGQVVCQIPHLPLTAGTYTISLRAEADGQHKDLIPNAGVFYVEGGDYFGKGMLSRSSGQFYVNFDWDYHRSM